MNDQDLEQLEKTRTEMAIQIARVQNDVQFRIRQARADFWKMVIGALVAGAAFGSLATIILSNAN